MTRFETIQRSIFIVTLSLTWPLLDDVAAADPISSVGPGDGVVQISETGSCGDLLFNSDGDYENGYCWRYGGVAEPYYGAFAECYSGEYEICSAVFDFSQTGGQSTQRMDVYIWDDDEGRPGAVRCVTVDADPGPIAFWPSLSRHAIDFSPACCVLGDWWVGYWGNWPLGSCGWYIGADTDGAGGCPMTNIMPGIGFPTGWQDVSVAWGPTAALGIGAEGRACGTEQGACCFADGTCEFLYEGSCNVAGGAYQGEGVPCEDVTCPVVIGACCFPNGDCEILIDVICIDDGGFFQGEDTPCDPGLCEDFRGACCFDDGACGFELFSDCVELSGVFQGDGVQCDPNPCPQLGACCFDSGVCESRVPIRCEQASGEFLGEGVACDPSPCEQPGACCFTDRTCTVAQADICLEAGGGYQGDATVCVPYPCPASCVEPRPLGESTVLTPAPDAIPFEDGRRGSGPNEGGSLLLHAEPGLVYTSDQSPYCGMSILEDCASAIATIDVVDPSVIFVFAAFPAESSPRMAGVAFGVEYDDCVALLDWGACGDFELPDSEWPMSGAGTAVTWGSPLTAALSEVYWFAAYSYYGLPARFVLVEHPIQGAVFADDSIPSVIDPVAELGQLGFFIPGVPACPDGELSLGACCTDTECFVVTEWQCYLSGGQYGGDGSDCESVPCNGGACCFEGICEVLAEDACLAGGGRFEGDGVPCDPNPCDVVPAIDTTWGRIKSHFAPRGRR